MSPKIFAPDVNAAVVRYQVTDLEASIAFYSKLGFELTHATGPVATVKRGELHLLLSAPASSGSKPLADGRKQGPGGWNRIVLYVPSLDASIEALAGASFRTEVVAGPGGRQILLDDPDGNPIELHEAPR